MKRFLYTALALIGLAALGVLCGYWVTNGTRQVEAQAAATGGQDDYVMVGGVRRPATDVQPTLTPPAEEDERPDVREAQLEPPEEEASEERQHERISMLIHDEPFQLQAYDVDRQGYLEGIEPSRAFQPAQPGPDVPRIAARSPHWQQVEQGGSVTLSVQAVPNMPVSFTSLGHGIFENGFSSVSVEADDAGLAQVTYTGTPPTRHPVSILAASPAASGQVKFIVHVIPPEDHDS